MKKNDENNRARLVRESLVFQVKLIADGMRDFMLVPVSLVATVVGLLRSAKDPELEFNRVLEIGKQSEQWINLFGTHNPIPGAGNAGSIDRLVTKAEEIVREQTRSGEVTRNASDAIEKALTTLHSKVRDEEDEKDEQPGQ